MRVGGRRRILRAAAPLFALAAASCTSISWDDAAGVRHHLGLVAVETLERDGARVVRRFAFGSDLDMARGGAWTLGAARTERVHVAESRVTDPHVLTDEFLAAIREEPGDAVKPGTWRFLYVTEDDSPRAALVERHLLGVGVAHGPELRGLYVGYAHGEAIDARVVGPDSALYVRHRAGYAARYRLWKM